MHKTWMGLLVLLQLNSFAAESSLKLSSDSIKKLPKSDQVEASGNVIVTYKNATIKADKIIFDQKQKKMTSTKNIEIKRKNTLSLRPKKLLYNLKENIAQLNAINIAIELPDSKKKLFIKSDTIYDYPDKKKGNNTILTSCDLETPHYFIWAQSFEYIPKKRIVATNLFVWNPIWIVPFGFWMPFYWYELGERQIIWNFPTIGKKTTPGWGYYVQNTIDYENRNGRVSSIYADYYQYKGIGLGINQEYDLSDSTKGNIYYYHFRETDTHQLNQKFKLSNTYSEGNHTLTYTLDSTDGERINGNGRNISTFHYLNYKHENFGDSFLLNLKHNDWMNQKNKQLQLNLKKSFNKFTNYSLNFLKNTQDAIQQTQYIANLQHNHELSQSETLTQTLDFSQLNNLMTPLADQTLKWNMLYTNKINKHLRLELRINQLFDLDEDRVTRDSYSAVNNYLFKHPELKLLYNSPLPFNINNNQTLTLGRYKEDRYLANRNKQRSFPESLSGLEPNTVIYDHNLSKSWSMGLFKTQTSASVGFTQYLFKLPDKDWFSGDAMNTLSTSLSSKSTLFNMIESHTRYISSYTPNENGSPFYSFNLAKTKQNSISYFLKWYVITPNSYFVSTSTKYNWILEQWDDLLITLYGAFSPQLNVKIQTGKKLSIKTINDKNNEYRATDINVNYASKENKIRYTLSLDTNQLINHEPSIRYSDIALSIQLGQDKSSRWKIETNIRYNTVNQPNYYDITRYEWQTISINKQEHKRKFTLSFNRLAQSFSFIYTIMAFNQDPIEISRTKDNWKIGGRFDTVSEERL